MDTEISTIDLLKSFKKMLEDIIDTQKVFAKQLATVTERLKKVENEMASNESNVNDLQQMNIATHMDTTGIETDKVPSTTKELSTSGPMEGLLTAPFGVLRPSFALICSHCIFVNKAN